MEYDRKNEVLGKLHESVKSLPLILSELQSLTDVLGLNIKKNLTFKTDKFQRSIKHSGLFGSYTCNIYKNFYQIET